MTEFVFSDAAKSKIGDYLMKSANIALGGHRNSFTWEQLNASATAALHQLLLDNVEITGYAAMLKQVEQERAA